MKKILLVVFLLVSGTLWSAEFKAGIASRVITPKLPFWMTGFASRTKPATEVLHDIWAKALVIEENRDSRIVIVTTDLLGLSHEVSEEIANLVIKKYGLTRSQLLLSSSHTHSGPVVWPSLSMLFNFNNDDQKVVAGYARKLTEDIVSVIDSAMSHLAPVKVWSGHGSADFAMNRRQPSANGIINGKNPDGPVDHDVPVLKITTPGGELKAVLFGYACHNTTIQGDSYLINGDYAGFAQLDLQNTYPGATAMFFMGCGADQNPQPRGTAALAKQHGKSLSDAVQKVLSGDLHPVHPPIRTDFTTVDLEFLPFDLNSFQLDILSADIYVQRRAKLMLESYNKGRDVSHFRYPVQVVRFNNDLTLLAMSDEVVVDYSLNIKKEFSNGNLFVAAYCTELMCYIPTLRILKEGGYEANTSMIYYGLPGPFTNNTEVKILNAIHRIMKHVGARPSK